MKSTLQRSTFVLICSASIVLLSSSIYGQGDPFQITEAPHMSPTIDGDVSDWAGVEGFEMSFAHGERSGDPNSEPLVVDIKYAWDESKFYTLVTEISDDDPTEGINDVDWCAECTGAAGGGPAPWSTDSIGFYDKGMKWPGLSEDPLEANILEVGPYHQYWVGLTTAEDLVIDGETQYRHLARTTNQAGNENGTSRLVGPRSEENEASLPWVESLQELNEPQSAFAVIPGDENNGRGRRVVEFYMEWDQIRYSQNDERQEVQDRVEELLPGIEGHFLEDVKAGYEFRLEPLLVDGIDDFSFGSQTHPSGVEHPHDAHTFEWEHISVVRLLAGQTGDLDGDGDSDADDIDALSAAIRAGETDGRFDINSDGAVNNADFVAFIEDTQGTWIGDSNLDGEFNSSDFVAVFGGGEYETGNDAGWALGDWNGDNKFDSGDFVAAFSAGGYELGPRDVGASSVPEPSHLGLALLGVLLAICGTRRRC